MHEERGDIFILLDFSFCKEVQYHNTPPENPVPALLCPDKREHWYRIGKLDMSSVWNKVDENQENILFEMVAAEELQTLPGLSFRYGKVILP